MAVGAEDASGAFLSGDAPLELLYRSIVVFTVNVHVDACSDEF
jgi:hypothetical protein